MVPDSCLLLLPPPQGPLPPVRHGGQLCVVDEPESELELEPEPELVGLGTQSAVPLLDPPVLVAVPLEKGLALLPPLALEKSQSQLP